MDLEEAKILLEDSGYLLKKSKLINSNYEKLFPYIHITHISDDIIRRTGLRIKNAAEGADHTYTEKRIHLFSVLPAYCPSYAFENGVRRKLTVEETGEYAFYSIANDPKSYLQEALSDSDINSIMNDVISYKAELLGLNTSDFNIYLCKLSESYPVYSDSIMTSNKARYITQNIPPSKVKLLGSAEEILYREY